MNAQELRIKAETLVKQSQFEPAAELYSQLWEQFPQSCDEWVAWNYARALRKVNRSRDAVEVCQRGRSIKPDFDRLNQIYGWALYDVYMKGIDETLDHNQFFKAANEIVSLTKQELYSPFTWIVFRMVDYLKKKPNPSYATILEWLDKLKPELLSREERSAPQSDEHNDTYASEQEKWYTTRVRALLEMNRHNECIELCTQVLSMFTSFHHDYDIWLHWYRARSLRAENRLEEALSDLKYVETKKREFFVKHEIALVYFQMGDLQNAIGIAAQASLGRAGLEFEWEMFLHMAQILNALGDTEHAQEHTMLAFKIRQENNWNIPNELMEIIRKLGLNTSIDVTARELHKRLRPFWETLKPRTETAFKGRIEKLHANGKSGFIRGEGGNTFFFAMRSVLVNPAQLAIGVDVGYNQSSVKNRDTGKEETHAVDVVLL